MKVILPSFHINYFCQRFVQYIISLLRSASASDDDEDQDDDDDDDDDGDLTGNDFFKKKSSSDKIKPAKSVEVNNK